MPNTNKYSYIVDGNAGEQEARRLELQHQIFGPDTKKFLIQLIKPGMHVIVPGCGTGEELLDIAHLVGLEGRVLGVDLNENQLAQARKKIEAAGVNNVDLHCSDLMDLAQFTEQFDLAFTRLVLVHVPDPQKALKSILSTLKRGGRLACEETVVSAAFTVPPKAVFAEHIALLMQFGKSIGVNFDLGNDLVRYFTHMGLANIQHYTTQPQMSDPEHKAIVPMSAYACAPAYIQRGLADSKHMQALVKKLIEQVVADENCVVSQIEVHHAVGTKNEAPRSQL